MIRINSISTELETIKNNFETIFNKGWFNDGYEIILKELTLKAECNHTSLDEQLKLDVHYIFNETNHLKSPK